MPGNCLAGVLDDTPPMPDAKPESLLQAASYSGERSTCTRWDNFYSITSVVHRALVLSRASVLSMVRRRPDTVRQKISCPPAGFDDEAVAAEAIDSGLLTVVWNSAPALQARSSATQPCLRKTWNLSAITRLHAHSNDCCSSCALLQSLPHIRFSCTCATTAGAHVGRRLAVRAAEAQPSGSIRGLVAGVCNNRRHPGCVACILCS